MPVVFAQAQLLAARENPLPRFMTATPKQAHWLSG
jgi:hypothetical protein